MRPDVQVLAGELADRPAADRTFFGQRWALRLCLVLLLGFALITAVRWRESTMSPTGPEIVVQQPVPPEAFPAANRSDTTAPDPGDNPP